MLSQLLQHQNQAIRLRPKTTNAAPCLRSMRVNGIEHRATYLEFPLERQHRSRQAALLASYRRLYRLEADQTEHTQLPQTRLLQHTQYRLPTKQDVTDEKILVSHPTARAMELDGADWSFIHSNQGGGEGLDRGCERRHPETRC